jgi:hypothetical protein
MLRKMTFEFIIAVVMGRDYPQDTITRLAENYAAWTKVGGRHALAARSTQPPLTGPARLPGWRCADQPLPRPALGLGAARSPLVRPNRPHRQTSALSHPPTHKHTHTHTHTHTHSRPSHRVCWPGRSSTCRSRHSARPCARAKSCWTSSRWGCLLLLMPLSRAARSRLRASTVGRPRSLIHNPWTMSGRAVTARAGRKTRPPLDSQFHHRARQARRSPPFYAPPR